MFDRWPVQVPAGPELIPRDERDSGAPELSETDRAMVGELIERLEAARPCKTSKKQRELIDYYDRLEARLTVPSTPEELDAAQVLAAAALAQAQANLAEAQLLLLACR